MEAENEIFLVRGNLAVPDGRAEIVHPAKVAALATTEESRFLWESLSCYSMESSCSHQARTFLLLLSLMMRMMVSLSLVSSSSVLSSKIQE